MEPTRTRTQTRQVDRWAHHHVEEMAAPPYNGKAVTAFVLGVVGFALPLVPSLFAVLFGHWARYEFRQGSDERGEGLALAGLILGWTGLVIGLALLIGFAFWY